MTTTEVIRLLCAKRNKSVTEVEKELGYSNGSLTKNNYLRSDRLQAIADYFGVTMEYLMTGEDPEQVSTEGNKYYFDDEAAELADFAHKNPEYKALFDASRNVKPEDINFVLEMIKRTSNNDD